MSAARNYREAHDLMETQHDAELERWIEQTSRRTKPRAAAAPKWADTMPTAPGGLMDDVDIRRGHAEKRRRRTALRELLPVLFVLLLAAVVAIFAKVSK